MFKPIDGCVGAAGVVIEVTGLPVQVRTGQSVALALLEAGFRTMRHTPVSGAPRSPLCLMGVCFECLVQVDGQSNVQACMVTVREGMQIRFQHGARAAESAE